MKTILPFASNLYNVSIVQCREVKYPIDVIHNSLSRENVYNNEKKTSSIFFYNSLSREKLYNNEL